MITINDNGLSGYTYLTLPQRWKESWLRWSWGSGQTSRFKLAQVVFEMLPNWCPALALAGYLSIYCVLTSGLNTPLRVDRSPSTVEGLAVFPKAQAKKTLPWSRHLILLSAPALFRRQHYFDASTVLVTTLLRVPTLL